jgi:UDP-N-acetyl-D-glucosamine dehydrogenase
MTRTSRSVETCVPTSGQCLRGKIQNGTARLGVVGLGYVGLPLAMTMEGGGFQVLGLDLNEDRVAQLNAAVSHIPDVDAVKLQDAIHRGRFVATTDLDRIGELDVVSICVPTPLRKTKDPDLSFVISAADAVAKRLRPGQLIILESTTYPGTTEEVLLPRFQASGYRAGKDFFLAYSPERVDPGNATFRTENIPKIVAGMTPECAELAALVYGRCITQVLTVSSTRVAEMVKLLENTFRAVNIGLANEVAMLCAHMDIDVWEVIRAASTKPFGFMPFYPGPGLGGHCIPIDPIYLQWKARMNGFELKFIELADRINSAMPEFVVRRTMELLNDRGKVLRGSHVHVLGVTYKRDIADVRESPALEIMALLKKRGAEVSYSDPFVPSITIGDQRLRAEALGADLLQEADLTMILTDHADFDYALVQQSALLIFDTRNALRDFPGENVARL